MAEHCIGETFQPRCPDSSSNIVVILAARYGRMQYGRCLKPPEPELASMMDTNPKFVGCSADVKSILDRECSGRAECSVRVTDQIFGDIKPCYAHLKMFLQASYMCIQGQSVTLHIMDFK